MSTTLAQAIHNSAALVELCSVTDASRYLARRRRLAGTHTPEARAHGLNEAARIMREAFDVAERMRTQAGDLDLEFCSIPVRGEETLPPGVAELRTTSGEVLGTVTYGLTR